MWFKHEGGSGRGWFGRGRPRNRTLRARASGGKSNGPGRAATIAIAVAGAAAGVAIVWAVLSYVGGKIYSRNQIFTIRDLQIVGGDGVVHFIRNDRKIAEGSNLFAFDITALREDFSKRKYTVKYRSLEISRILPATLRVEATERTPVAALAGLVVDAEGCVFGTAGGKKGLPEIKGLRGPAPAPGDRIKGNARDALLLLDMWERTGLGRERKIVAVDVCGGFAGMPDDMRLRLDDETQVDLWWQRSGLSTLSPADDLRGRLGALARELFWAKQQCKRVKTINLTLESYTNSCPATFYE
jgi:hypothetical protein